MHFMQSTWFLCTWELISIIPLQNSIKLNCIGNVTRTSNINEKLKASVQNTQILQSPLAFTFFAMSTDVPKWCLLKWSIIGIWKSQRTQVKWIRGLGCHIYVLFVSQLPFLLSFSSFKRFLETIFAQVFLIPNLLVKIWFKLFWSSTADQDLPCTPRFIFNRIPTFR